jgi:hypothetical protein
MTKTTNNVPPIDLSALPDDVRSLAETPVPRGESRQFFSDSDDHPTFQDGVVTFVRGGSVAIDGQLFSRRQYVVLRSPNIVAWRNGGARNYLCLKCGGHVSYFFYKQTNSSNAACGWYRHVPRADMPEDAKEGAINWYRYVIAAFLFAGCIASGNSGSGLLTMLFAFAVALVLSGDDG